MHEIDETPDSTRPGNVWPRLLAFGALIVLALVAVGGCLLAYASSAPDRELDIDSADLVPGVPRLLPVTTWGGDASGRTFGVWVVLPDDASGPRAFLSRDPQSGCHVRWSNGADGGPRDVFVDPCEGTQYAPDGERISDPGGRGLDRFEVRIDAGTLRIPVERVQLGSCDGSGALPCSTPDAPLERKQPSGSLGGGRR